MIFKFEFLKNIKQLSSQNQASIYIFNIAKNKFSESILFVNLQIMMNQKFEKNYFKRHNILIL